MKQIVLASKSPRRKELLEKAGIKFKVVESKLEEYFDLKLKPHALAKKLSLEKARAVCQKNPPASPRGEPAGGKDSIIISADTLIVCGGKILGKPQDEKDAKKMLKLLSGKTHYVITGFTVYDTETNRSVTKSASSKVYFNKISIEEIDNYVTAKKPLDKAGAYGIQELPKTFIKKIDGDYDNVVGLPVQALLKELKKLDAF